eukprot:845469-Rhodomonas_salina.3
MPTSVLDFRSEHAHQYRTFRSKCVGAIAQGTAACCRRGGSTMAARSHAPVSHHITCQRQYATCHQTEEGYYFFFFFSAKNGDNLKKGTKKGWGGGGADQARILVRSERSDPRTAREPAPLVGPPD